MSGFDTRTGSPDLLGLDPSETAAPAACVRYPFPRPASDEGAPPIGTWGNPIGRDGPAPPTFADRMGARDREAAATELAGKFTVVDDDASADRAPNEVTAAEYAEIVRTYSDIRMGFTDIEIDGSDTDDPAAFRAAMMDDLGDIMQTTSGREMIGQLAHNVRDVDGEQVHRKTTLSANLDPVTGEPSSLRAGASVNVAPRVGSPDPDNGAPGAGADTLVSIMPDQDVGAPGFMEIRSDVALYHELVHALHNSQGTLATGHVTEADAQPIDVTAGLLGIGAQAVEMDLGLKRSVT